MPGCLKVRFMSSSHCFVSFSRIIKLIGLGCKVKRSQYTDRRCVGDVILCGPLLFSPSMFPSIRVCPSQRAVRIDQSIGSPCKSKGLERWVVPTMHDGCLKQTVAPMTVSLSLGLNEEGSVFEVFLSKENMDCLFIIIIILTERVKSSH